MAASPSSVLTLGLGSWGSPSLLICFGYGSGAAAIVTVNPNAIRVDLIGTASRFTLNGSPARAGTLVGTEARSV